MAKYIIHACPKRMWYVENYLVPSMKDQGIEDIVVACDTEGLGNLNKCMQIFHSMDSYGAAWHMQDDVIICRDFKKRTEQFEPHNVVCGFVIEKDENFNYSGKTVPEHMWWSFPCIQIPNKLAYHCAEWFYGRARMDLKYKHWVKSGKYDDAIFKDFLVTLRPSTGIINLKPNLVDHIDYLIGGTTVNEQRDYLVKSACFPDPDLVEELRQKLREKI